MIGLRWLENINPLTSGLMVINHGRKYKITLNKQKKSCWFGVPRVPDVAECSTTVHYKAFQVGHPRIQIYFDPQFIRTCLKEK